MTKNPRNLFLVLVMLLAFAMSVGVALMGLALALFGRAVRLAAWIPLAMDVLLATEILLLLGNGFMVVHA
jgi:hypothetical protein